MSTRIPALSTTIGKNGAIIDPVTRHKEKFIVLDDIHRKQTGKDDKTIVLQKIRFDSGRLELRLGYYIIGKKEARSGEWVWGQYATLLPIEDYIYLYKEAERKGWLTDAVSYRD